MKSIEQQYQDEIDELKIQKYKLAVALKEVLLVTSVYHRYDSAGRTWLEDARDLLDEAELLETCTRVAPHSCRKNGPCNGWPKD